MNKPVRHYELKNKTHAERETERERKYRTRSLRFALTLPPRGGAIKYLRILTQYCALLIYNYLKINNRQK